LFSQDEQLARLSEENEKLKRTIDEISKNIDRLENGQGTYFVV
jgi:cell division protein FtsB